MTMHSHWKPHSASELAAAIEHIEYEARWLGRGHDAWSELRERDPDLANLAYEAALVHCRVVLDFLLPRSKPRHGDVFACEFVDMTARAPSAVVTPEACAEAFDAEIDVVRSAIDGWLAHLGRARLEAQPKPDWNRVLAGCRDLFVTFADGLSDQWRGPLQPARNAAARH